MNRIPPSINNLIIPFLTVCRYMYKDGNQTQHYHYPLTTHKRKRTLKHMSTPFQMFLINGSSSNIPCKRKAGKTKTNAFGKNKCLSTQQAALKLNQIQMNIQFHLTVIYTSGQIKPVLIIAFVNTQSSNLSLNSQQCLNVRVCRAHF